MNRKLFAVLFLILFISLPIFAETEYPNLPYKELIFPLEQIPRSHASSIVELPSGELFAVWYAPVSPNSKAVIWGSRRPVGANKWTTPSIINYTPGRSNKNPVLYLDQDKKLWLFWADEIKLPFKINKDILRMKASGDFGHTWGEANNVGKLAWFLARTHPIRLQDGRIILPIYTDLYTSSAVAISKDGGLTWDGPKFLLFFFGIQPTIIQRSDLSLFALTRSGMWPRLSWQAVSYDLGQSWKNQRCSSINNPGFSLEMIKLRSGNVVLAFNDSKTDRSSLSLALSCDEGKTWPYVKVIECKAGHIYGYPSIMQDRHGLIHVVYSYNKRSSIVHFVTDEQWIEGFKARAKGAIP
jgi:predicted neuraminidase